MTKRKPQDLFSTISKDHRAVEKLFRQLKKARGKRREDIYAELRNELLKHAEAEEYALYPRLVEREPTKDIGFESEEEHGLVKHLFSRLDVLEVDDERWEPTLTVLEEIVSHHVEEEESTMYARIRRAFTKEEREELRLAFLARKASVMSALKRLVA